MYMIDNWVFKISSLFYSDAIDWPIHITKKKINHKMYLYITFNFFY